ncbi:hypothetical protein BDV98DRAFT_659743 [Pterulicium gracile]|uniref:Uncharacterized protein n=1 Tax=Pterulicium gracile TaxID=1884261 RepID=A0A5C3Q1N5_9AGAR|nr:hypothetical protein BDV98DRAFT_659743 [Pterula gracilis]
MERLLKLLRRAARSAQLLALYERVMRFSMRRCGHKSPDTGVPEMKESPSYRHTLQPAQELRQESRFKSLNLYLSPSPLFVVVELLYLRTRRLRAACILLMNTSAPMVNPEAFGFMGQEFQYIGYEHGGLQYPQHYGFHPQQPLRGLPQWNDHRQSSHPASLFYNPSFQGFGAPHVNTASQPNVRGLTPASASSSNFTGAPEPEVQHIDSEIPASQVREERPCRKRTESENRGGDDRIRRQRELTIERDTREEVRVKMRSCSKAIRGLQPRTSQGIGRMWSKKGLGSPPHHSKLYAEQVYDACTSLRIPASPSITT